MWFFSRAVKFILSFLRNLYVTKTWPKKSFSSSMLLIGVNSKFPINHISSWTDLKFTKKSEYTHSPKNWLTEFIEYSRCKSCVQTISDVRLSLKMRVKKSHRRQRSQRDQCENEYSDVPRTEPHHAAPMPSGRPIAQPSDNQNAAKPKSRIRKGNTNKIVDMLERRNFVP